MNFTRSLNFDGLSQFVTIDASSGSLNFSGDMSLIGWFSKFAATSATANIVQVSTTSFY